ncbi:MAG: hypothetical protein AAFQ01_04735, partial [Bacteroidota bacterium]
MPVTAASDSNSDSDSDLTSSSSQRSVFPFPLVFPFLFLFPFQFLSGQLPPAIQLTNPSFEGEPADATMPVGWFVSTPGTTPDILPGYWGVYQEASDGDTYVGLITRPDGSWEAMAQRLPRPLKAKDCYQLVIDLAHSKTYSGYNGPLKLRIYGGRTRTDRSLLLYESPLINHTYWKTYPVRFNLDQDVQYIILEAFHSEAS